MLCPYTRRFHRRLRHSIGFLLLGVLLVFALASLARADMDKSPSVPQFEQQSPVRMITSAATTDQRRYNPGPVSRPDDTIVGAPKRGDDFCGPNADANGAFTALAPLSHLGKTTATHPTFAWFIPDAQPEPVTFTLFYPPSAQTPPFTIDVPSRAGIVSFPLPPKQAGLKPGRYRWQIQRDCIPKLLEATMEFEVVKPPVKLEERWYDTLAEALHISDSDRKDKQVLSLLSDLQAIEATAAKQIRDEPNNPSTWKEVLTAQSQHLSQVIEAQQQRRSSRPL